MTSKMSPRPKAMPAPRESKLGALNSSGGMANQPSSRPIVPNRELPSELQELLSESGVSSYSPPPARPVPPGAASGFEKAGFLRLRSEWVNKIRGSKAAPLAMLALSFLFIVSDMDFGGGEISGGALKKFEPKRQGSTISVPGSNDLSADDSGVPSAYTLGPDGLPVEAAAGARVYGEPLSPAVLAAHNVLMYPECPRYDPSRALMVAGDDRAFAVEQLAESPVLVKPFPTATYFCQLLAQPLYKDLLRLVPPEALFENAAKREGANGTCVPGDCRYSLSAFALLKMRPETAAPVWGSFEEGVKVWRRLLEIVFSKDFEGLLWSKLGLPPSLRVKRREMRILIDKKGYGNGRVHTDMDAQKIATMQIYLAHDTVAIWDYGTCLHNRGQFDRRKMLPGGGSHGRNRDGEAECYFKFRFLPNSGYAFAVSPESYHSAPNSRTQHWIDRDRHTVMFNWY